MALSTSGKMTVLTCYYFSIQRSDNIQYYQHRLQCKQIGIQKGYYLHSQGRGKYKSLVPSGLVISTKRSNLQCFEKEQCMNLSIKYLGSRKYTV